MASIGWASLQIIPTMRGVSGQLTGQLAGPMRQAGQQAGEQAGRAAGEGMASGIESARAAVSKASAKLAAARDKEADAAGKVRVAEAKLQELRDKGNASASQLAAAEERLATAQRGADRAQQARITALNDLTAARARAANAANEDEQATRRWRDSLDGIGSSASNAAKSVAGMAVAAAGIGGAMELVGQAFENMDIESNLAAQLGATGDLAAEYGAHAGELYKSGIAGSMEEAAAAIGMVANSFRTAGFEGEASMEQIAANATTFSNVFEQDVSSSVQTASQLIQNGLAKDSTEAFDLMTRAFQTVPAAMREELPEILQEYGTNFRALGFDGEESFNILVAAAEQGKFALDKTGDALKEFTIRGSDMSTASTDAFTAIGLDAAEMAKQIAAGGDGAQEALQKTAQSLLEMEDPATRANTAIALFGTPLEDLSIDQIPAFLQGLTGAENAMAGFAGSTQQMSDTVNSGPNHAMSVLKNTIQSTITDGIGAAAQFLVEHADLWKQIGAVVGDIASATLPAIWSALQTGVGILGEVADAVAGVVNWFREHEVVAGIVAGVITVGLLPALTSMTIGFATSAASAVASGATLTAVWISTQASAIASSAAQVAAQYKTVAGWVAAGAAAVANGAIMVGQWIAAGATATAQAAIAAGAWVASSAKTVGALALQGAAFIAQRAVMVAGAVATATATAAQWAFNAALSANPIGLIIAAVAALVAGLVWFFTQTEVGQRIVTAAWDAIRTGWDAMWSGVSAGIDAFGGALSWIGTKATEAKDWVVGKFNELVGFVTGLPGRIASAASGMWDGIKSAFKAAINYIIQVWNALEFRIPGFEVGPVKWDGFVLGLPDIPTLATGGVAGRRPDGTLWGPGTGTSDSILGIDTRGVPTARVSAGEGVVKKSAMDAGGDQVVAALNAGWLPGYAEGGVVSPDQLVNFAKGVEGKPYVWGGVNWGDCSGAISALANFATGRDPFASRFATMTEGAELAARGFKSGLGPTGSLQVGWYNGGPYGGHTAATLPNGVNFEMGGNRGNGQYGGQAAGARDPMFTDHAYLPMIVAQLVQPSVEQVAPIQFPSDNGTATMPSTGGTTTPGATGSSPSTSSGASTTGAEVTQTFSGRERFKQFGEELGGIWADAAVEALGIGEWLDLADRYTIKAEGGTTATAAAPEAGVTAAPPAAPTSPLDPANGIKGDLNMAPFIEQARGFLKSVGLFDTGGVWEPNTFGFNGLSEPEYVLKDAHWKTAKANVDKVDQLVGAGAAVGGGGNVYNTYATFRDEDEYYRRRTQEQRLDMKRHLGRWSR